MELAVRQAVESVVTLGIFTSGIMICLFLCYGVVKLIAGR